MIKECKLWSIPFPFGPFLLQLLVLTNLSKWCLISAACWKAVWSRRAFTEHDAFIDFSIDQKPNSLLNNNFKTPHENNNKSFFLICLPEFNSTLLPKENLIWSMRHTHTQTPFPTYDRPRGESQNIKSMGMGALFHRLALGSVLNIQKVGHEEAYVTSGKITGRWMGRGMAVYQVQCSY